MRFNHICIVGVGLIGGSFALAARKARPATRITGWDEPQVIEEACAAGLIDGVEESFAEGRVCEADLIYLAAPVTAIINFLISRGGRIKPGAIVTDAGSTKRDICRAASDSLPDGVAFVGGHPMAGSHESGLRFATSDLFSDAPYVVVIDEQSRRDHLRQSDATAAVVEVIREIGAHPVMISAEEHDRIVARVSHAPQLLSIALALSAARAGDRAIELAGSGFADMTRLAESRWGVWEGICRTNADEIGATLETIIHELELIRKSISNGGFAEVGGAFDEANEFMRKYHTRSERVKTDRRE
jgi:prephenate dehydrogenase